MKSTRLRAAVISALIFLVFISIWTLATLPTTAPVTGQDAEYAALMGGGAEKSEGFPTPLTVGKAFVKFLSDPLYVKGPNDKGIGIQLAYSLARVGVGFLLAMVVAVPLGFVIGRSKMMTLALDPYIQVLKPISPLAWMPLALYTLKDSGTSAIFVIFICSIWPMLINTAFGVASVRHEWINVARTLEVNPLRKAFLVILPAAAPTILTGMRISMGIAWLVIVAAEMLVGGTGIGYFVWNEWNNLSLPNVIFAVVMIGLVGMGLDMIFGTLQKLLSYRE